MTPDEDLGGWGPRAWDQIARRVDALRADVNVLMGRRPDDDPPRRDAGEPRIGGIGIGTWVAIVATIVVPIVVAIIVTGNAP